MSVMYGLCVFEQNGDEFMRRLEPISSTIPYMTAEGNHGM